MKKYYIQPILLFNIALPLLALLIGIGVTKFTQSTLIGDFESKKQVYESEIQQTEVLKKLASTTKSKREQLNRWKRFMASDDTFTDVKQHFKLAKNNHNQTQTLQTDLNKEDRIIIEAPSPYSTFSFRMEGTYAEIQRSLLEVESYLPNTMADTFSIKPKPNSRLIQINAKYTLWESN